MVGRNEKSRRMFLDDGESLTRYFQEIAGFRILTLAEEQELLSRYREGDKRALQALVEANLKFVVAVCFNYTHRGLPLGDMINEGNLGLIRAANHYQPGLNVKFISYAVWWIRQGILNALANQGRVLSVSPNIVRVKQDIRRAEGRLMQVLGRLPTVEELAEATGHTPEIVSRSLALDGKPQSIDDHFNHEAALSKSESSRKNIPPDPDDRVGAAQFRMAIEKILDSLDARDSRILKMYYGIGSGTPLNLSEIAGRFGLTRERVRQIRERSLARLRKNLGKDELSELGD